MVKTLAWIVIAACGLDAFLTMYELRGGIAYEVNPVMAFFLDSSEVLFVIAKMFLTGIGVFLLVKVSKMDGGDLGVPILGCFVLIYVGLTFWHIHILTRAL